MRTVWGSWRHRPALQKSNEVCRLIQKQVNRHRKAHSDRYVRKIDDINCEAVVKAPPGTARWSQRLEILDQRESVTICPNDGPKVVPAVSAARPLDVEPKGIPLPDVNKFEDALRGQGTPVEIFTYEAGHGFFAYNRDEAYQPEAAKLAWGRDLAFFKHRLE